MTISLGVFAWQLAILIVIIIAAIYGGPVVWGIVVIVIALWTITQVFTSGLMATQFATILIAVAICICIFLWFYQPALLVLATIGIAVWFYYQNSSPKEITTAETPRTGSSTSAPSPPAQAPLAEPQPNSHPAKSGAKSQRVAKAEPVRDPWKEYDDRQSAMHKERLRLIETIAAKYPQLDPKSPSFGVLCTECGSFPMPIK